MMIVACWGYFEEEVASHYLIILILPNVCMDLSNCLIEFQENLVLLI